MIFSFLHCSYFFLFTQHPESDEELYQELRNDERKAANGESESSSTSAEEEEEEEEETIDSTDEEQKPERVLVKVRKVEPLSDDE